MIFKRKNKITSNTLIIFDRKRQQMSFYWNKFIEIKNLCDCYIDKNTEEYSKLNHLGWLYFDKYMSLFNQGYTDFEQEEKMTKRKGEE